MFKARTILLIFFSLIPVFSVSKESQSKKLYQNSSQNLKNQKSLDNVDELLKQIDSARKQLKSQELRLQDIQNKIIERRMNNSQ